ncbi:MAG: hypothetical protein K1X79_12055 [Oligoflexia bacterium]|nr:hypothetical protein [Oligoflexia bacterium]
MKELKEQLAKLLAAFNALSGREKGLIVAGAAVMCLLGLYKVYEPVQLVFSEQVQEVQKAENDARSASALLERYAKLKARRDAIEREYKEVEFKEGALSHLENMVKNKAGVASGFTIKDSPPVEFGGEYEQTLFSVKFTTTNLPGLVDFLKELSQGPKPMILGKVDIQRSRFADRLETDIDVSSIRKVR